MNSVNNRNTKFDEEVEFVAKHYRKNAFRRAARFVVPEGIRRNPAGSMEQDNMQRGEGFVVPDVLRCRRVARRWIAAASCAVVLSASAYFISQVAFKPVAKPEPSRVETVSVKSVAAEPEEIRRIEFNDAPLSTVAAEVERVYGVELDNITDPDVRISISYEGTASDFVETVNELLGTHITIKGENKNTETNRK